MRIEGAHRTPFTPIHFGATMDRGEPHPRAAKSASVARKQPGASLARMPAEVRTLAWGPIHRRAVGWLQQIAVTAWSIRANSVTTAIPLQATAARVRVRSNPTLFAQSKVKPASALSCVVTASSTRVSNVTRARIRASRAVQRTARRSALVIDAGPASNAWLCITISTTHHLARALHRSLRNLRDD